jgi:hypothetical protein
LTKHQAKVAVTYPLHQTTPALAKAEAPWVRRLQPARTPNTTRTTISTTLRQNHQQIFVNFITLSASNNPLYFDLYLSTNAPSEDPRECPDLT